MLMSCVLRKGLRTQEHVLLNVITVTQDCILSCFFGFFISDTEHLYTSGYTSFGPRDRVTRFLSQPGIRTTNST